MTDLALLPRSVEWGHTDSTRVPPNDRSWKEQPLPPDRNPSPFVTIYGLTNSAGDVCYIGRTGKTLNHRLSRHRTQARDKGGTCTKRVSEWIRSEGYEVGIVPLEVVERDRASRAEWEWIQKFKSEGVELANRQGYDWSPDPVQREIIIATNRKRFEDPAARARIGRISRERVFSDEERAAMSARAKGRRHTPEARAKMSASKKGVLKSPETRARMSAAQQRRSAEGNYPPLSDEHRAKLSAAHKGKPKSEETKRKMREAWVARRQRQVMQG